jgi:hypothetical protein
MFLYSCISARDTLSKKRQRDIILEDPSTEAINDMHGKSLYAVGELHNKKHQVQRENCSQE